MKRLIRIRSLSDLKRWAKSHEITIINRKCYAVIK